MAADNKSLGNFDLIGIPPAPRGVPQIEVSFDIDANGIVNVSAKDKATGKEQSIVIQSSGGLSDKEIEDMMAAAEANAEGDKERKSLIEARNECDSLVYSTEKSLQDHGKDLSEEDQAEVKKAIEEAKKAKDDENLTSEELREKVKALSAAAMKIGQAMYGNKGAEGGEGAEGEKKADDAEFTESEDSKKGDNKKE